MTPSPQTVVTIKVSVDRLNIILEALGNQPFIRVADTINDLRMQATIQLAEVPAETKKED